MYPSSEMVKKNGANKPFTESNRKESIIANPMLGRRISTPSIVDEQEDMDEEEKEELSLYEDDDEED